jgi:hypothetical protein
LELRINQAYKSFYLDNKEVVVLDDTTTYDVTKSQLFCNGKEVVLRKVEKEVQISL